MIKITFLLTLYDYPNIIQFQFSTQFPIPYLQWYFWCSTTSFSQQERSNAAIFKNFWMFTYSGKNSTFLRQKLDKYKSCKAINLERSIFRGTLWGRIDVFKLTCNIYLNDENFQSDFTKKAKKAKIEMSSYFRQEFKNNVGLTKTAVLCILFLCICFNAKKWKTCCIQLFSI